MVMAGPTIPPPTAFFGEAVLFLNHCGCAGWSAHLSFAKPHKTVFSHRGPYYVFWTLRNSVLKCSCTQFECRTKHPGTKHPMPFFANPHKTSRINLPPRTKHPMQFLSPRTKHPMPFLPPRTKHPMLLLPPRTKHPTLCLKPMKVHKTSHLVNCHYYYWYS